MAKPGRKVPSRARVWLLSAALLLLLGGVRLWFSDTAEEWRLRRAPLAELQRQSAAQQLDFRGASILAGRLMDAGRLQEAEPLLRKLIDADRGHGLAYARLGTLLARTGRQSEAFQVLRIGISRAPHLPDAHLALAGLYATRQAYPHAVRELRTALDLDPRLDAAWHQLASCYDELSQPTHARAALLQATQVAPRNDEYWVELARLETKGGRPNEAQAYLRRALELNPKSPSAHYSLAEVLLSRPGGTPADLPTAESHLRAALAVAPGYPPALYQLGMAGMRRRDWSTAAVHLREALRSAPAFQEAMFNLARAYARLGRAPEARRLRARFYRLEAQEQQILDLRTRVGLGPEDPALYFRLARAYRDAGDVERAYETLVSGLQRDPRNATARAELQRLARMTGRAVIGPGTQPAPTPSPSPNNGRGVQRSRRLESQPPTQSSPPPLLGEGAGGGGLPTEPDASARYPMMGSVSVRQPLFTDVAQAAGIRFRFGYGGRSPLDILEIMGGGAGLLDVDGDGWLDVLLVGPSRSALYRNNRDGTFRDITPGSGLPGATHDRQTGGRPPDKGTRERGNEGTRERGNEGTTPGPVVHSFPPSLLHSFPYHSPVWMGCAAGDFDDDGRVDLLLTGFPRAALYRNRGGGRFVEVGTTAGVRPPGWTSSAAFADVDRDGRVDLFVGRYVRWDSHAVRFCNVEGLRTACGPEMYDPEKGLFYRNVGNGRFAESTTDFGFGDSHGKTLGVCFADFNDDGRLDLYLANDQMPCDLYENQSGQRFHNIGLASGTAFSRDGVRQGGMGVDWGDVDGDGRLDLFVTTFFQQPKSLYRNEGGGLFTEIGDAAGISSPTLPYVAFGTRFFDLDNDGNLDLFIANGHVRDNVARVDPAVRYEQPMQLFRNDGRGVFRDLSKAAGPALARPIAGRAAAFGDVDNDGDVDLLVVDGAGSPLLLRNEIGNRRHWLMVRALTATGRDAIGARITVTVRGRRRIAEVCPGASYLATNDPRVHFGLGDADRVDRVEIRWPGGRTEERRDVRADRILTLTER